MTLTEALKVIDLIDKYTGAEGQDFPTEQKILEALFTMRDALINSAAIVYDEHGQMQATAVAEHAAARGAKGAQSLPADQVPIAMRQRALPVDLQLAINAQLEDCGTFLKPVLMGRPPGTTRPVFNGLLEALVSIAEIGVTGRRDPRIFTPGNLN